ncbi:hypothetical protein PG996_003128 [Apiospora saccharicola]|uniref:RING-type domain-containing protein n=1 Tax=Apiospora saccharicola TaxID=335842 RepID=A0ABR1W0G4_9PEZI
MAHHILNFANWTAYFDQRVEAIRMSEIDRELARLTDEAKAQEQQQASAQIEPEECPICKDESEQPQNDFVTLPCNGAHRAHPDCFRNWLQSENMAHDKCPLCRQSLRYSCGQVLDVDLLVAGTVIPQQSLDATCSAACPGEYAHNYDAFYLSFRDAMQQTEGFHYPLILAIHPEDINDDVLHEWAEDVMGRVEQFGHDLVELLQQNDEIFYTLIDQVQQERENMATRAARNGGLLHPERVEELDLYEQSVSKHHQDVKDRLGRLLDGQIELGAYFDLWCAILNGDVGQQEDEDWWRTEAATLESFPAYCPPAAQHEGNNVNTRDEAGVPPAATPPTSTNHSWNGPGIGKVQPGNDNDKPAEDWSNAIPAAAAEHHDDDIVDTNQGETQKTLGTPEQSQPQPQ